MNERINQLLERLNEMMVKWPGLLPLVGIGFIVLNFLLHLFPGRGFWLVDTNLFLHLGLLVSLLGLLLVNVYR